MQSAMTAEYELTKEDWSAFNFYHHFHSPTARRQYLRAWVSSVARGAVRLLGDFVAGQSQQPDARRDVPVTVAAL